MTTQEINNELKLYAQEDTQLAIQGGAMSVTDTKVGVINLNYDNNMFEAFNNMGEALTGKMNRENMINWLVSQYIVEISA